MAHFENNSESAPYAEDALAAARRFFAQQKKLLIDGAWRPAAEGDSFDVINPAIGERIASCASGVAADADAAVRAARNAFVTSTWSGMKPEGRSALLLSIATALEEHAEELAAIQSAELGATPALSRSLVAGGIETFRYYSGWPTIMTGETLPSDEGRFSWTIREPLGVIAAVIPWNGPAQAVSWKVAPALACGNTVVLKPASEAPLVAIRIVELMVEAGLPAGVVNVVTGSGKDVGKPLAEHPDVDKVTFTGSTAVGKSLMAAGATSLKRLTLELGGKSPTILFADADLDSAVRAAVLGFCAGAGQNCVAGSRILVESSIYDDVVERVATAVASMTLGSALESGGDVPPIVSARQLGRVMEYIEKGRAEGARLIAGGAKRNGPGFFVEPTVFCDVTSNMTVAREEVFGPVAAIMRFDDEEHAIRLANDVQYGLSASVWTADVSRMHRMINALACGTVWGNTIFELDSKAPFGGYKQSGLGRELGSASIEAFTRVKTAMIRFG